MLSLLVIINVFLGVTLKNGISDESLELGLIFIFDVSSNSFEIVSVLLDPLLLHSFTKSDLGDLFPASILHFSHIAFLSHFHFANELELWRSILGVTVSLISEFNELLLNDIKLDIVVNEKRLQDWFHIFF